MHIKRSQLRRLINEALEEMDDLATSTDAFMDAEEELAVAQDAQDTSNTTSVEALINNLLSMIETLDPGGATADKAMDMVEKWEEENQMGGFKGYGEAQK